MTLLTWLALSCFFWNFFKLWFSLTHCNGCMQEIVAKLKFCILSRDKRTSLQPAYHHRNWPRSSKKEPLLHTQGGGITFKKWWPIFEYPFLHRHKVMHSDEIKRVSSGSAIVIFFKSLPAPWICKELFMHSSQMGFHHSFIRHQTVRSNSQQ